MEKTFAERLIKLRGDKTQTEISQAIGVGRSTYSMYENGKRIPSDSVKIKLSDLFGITVQELFFD